MDIFRWDIPPHVGQRIRHLPPDLKRGVKAARDLALGEPLRGELAGLWKYRVKRFRIVYVIDRPGRVLRVFAVGHRRGIYEAVAKLLRRGL